MQARRAGAADLDAVIETLVGSHLDYIWEVWALSGSPGDRRARLTELTARHRHLLQPRGTGLLQGLVVGGTDLRENTRQIVNRMAADHRVLIGAEGPQANVLKMRPPMPFSTANAELLLSTLDDALAAL